MGPQKMPLWPVDCFELKAVEVCQTQGEVLFLFLFSLYLSLNCLEEFRWRACTRKRANTRDNFLYKKTLCAWQGSICLSNMCPSYLPVNCLPRGPLEVPDSCPLLLSSGWLISLTCFSVRELPLFGVPGVQNLFVSPLLFIRLT